MGIRAAAIYLWYTLYFKQPTRPKVRLHVDKREYSDLNKFLKQCREERHWEIVYCWSKLIGTPFTNIVLLTNFTKFLTLQPIMHLSFKPVTNV